MAFTHKPISQVDVSSGDNAGDYPDTKKGRNLYKTDKLLVLYLLIIFFYFVAFFSFTGWSIIGPNFNGDGGLKVLRTGGLVVNQIYSGLILSTFLTPAAIVSRKLSADLGGIHPFAIASRRPVEINHLDTMMDPGLFATLTTFRYSVWHALVQSFLLLAGALIVPVGTLVVTTGSYTPQANGRALTGIPVPAGSTSYNGETARDLRFDAESGYNGVNDAISPSLLLNFKSEVTSNYGQLLDYPSSLGPVSSPANSITYHTGFEYRGVLGFYWQANCAAATDVQHTAGYNDSTHVTDMLYEFSDGKTMKVSSFGTKMYTTEGMRNFNESLPGPGESYDYGSTYFITSGNSTLNNTKYPVSGDNGNIVQVNGTWISIVKCTPRIAWSISSCIWNGTLMTNCLPTPGANTTTIDTAGLNLVLGWFTQALRNVVIQDRTTNTPQVSIFGANEVQVALTHGPRAPGINDHVKLYGLVAHGISQLTTAGYYSTAEITSFGGVPYRVYVVRLYILALVLTAFFIVLLLSSMDLAWHKLRRLPTRKGTFLTIANAVRGGWWDAELYGSCAMNEKDAKEALKGAEVMFGVDRVRPDHIGLAPSVDQIDLERHYN
ncbi:hypothetical protein KCU67_g455, partial [Aureobasidium melanogenum]